MPSNSGALLPHSAAMLGVLYGALSHSTAHPCATPLLFRFIPPHHGNVGSAPSLHMDVRVPRVQDAQERPALATAWMPEVEQRMEQLPDPT